jgi:hypothetical protein
MFLNAPNKNKRITSKKTFGANPSNEIINAYPIVDIVMILIDENLAISQLDIGKATTNPTEMENKTAPSSAFDKLNCF